jgi:hypothetical protein
MNIPETHSIRTSQEWLTYYKHNASHQRPIPWSLGPDATPGEINEIKRSLQAWQLGETSDGHHLMKAATRYSKQTSDQDFIDVARLFIKEEQRHGELLGRFLDLAGVPRKKWDAGDALFRLVRYALPNMELWTTPVIMVETLALLYYQAIHDATHSRVLRAICNQILYDEIAHIQFQYERFAAIMLHRPLIMRLAFTFVQRLLFAVIVLLVWVSHGRALRAGGLSFRSFWGAAWKKMNYAWRRMHPRNYDWGETTNRPVHV